MPVHRIATIVLSIFLLIVFFCCSRPSPGEVKLRVWVVDESAKVRPNDAPQTSSAVWSKAHRLISIYGAKNETVGFQVVLRAGERTPAIDVSVSDLVQGSRRLSQKQITLFRELFLKVTDQPEPKFVTLGPGEFPDPLIPWVDPYGSGKRIAAPFDLPADKNQPLWVDVNIPEDTPAGTYRGELAVSSQGRVMESLPIELTVWDFSLPKERHLASYIPLYAKRLGQAEGFYEGDHPNEQTWPIVKQYYVMALQHRFVTQIIDGTENPSIEWGSDGSLRAIHWSGYDRYLGSVLDGSLVRDCAPPDVWKVAPFVWWGCRPGDMSFGGCNYQKDAHLSSAAKNAIANYAKAVADHFSAKKWGVKNVFMYFVDEPDLRAHPHFKSLIVDYGRAVHQKTRKVKHFVTISPDDLPEAVGSIDIWGTWATGYVPAVMQNRQKAGDQTWFYQSRPPFVGGSNINDEGLGFRTWPWIAWKYRVDGIFLWVGNFWNDQPYRVARNWNEDLQGNGVMFYPGKSLHTIGLPDIAGPVPSFRMKAWRRGMQDYAYLWLLKESGFEQEADAFVSRLVGSALNHGGFNPPWHDPLWAQPGNWSHDTAVWEEVRREMAGMILHSKTSNGR